MEKRSLSIMNSVLRDQNDGKDGECSKLAINFNQLRTQQNGCKTNKHHSVASSGDKPQTPALTDITPKPEYHSDNPLI